MKKKILPEPWPPSKAVVSLHSWGSLSTADPVVCPTLYANTYMQKYCTGQLT